MPTADGLSNCKFCGEFISWSCTESSTTNTKRWLPRNPDKTDHRATCQGMSPSVRATVKADSHETQVRKFLAGAKLQRKKRKAADLAVAAAKNRCKFCGLAITWKENVPLNLDGTRHAAGCTGRPSGQVKNVMEAMIQESRRAASESLSNGC